MLKKFAKNLQSYEAAKASFRMKFWIFGYFWPKIDHISAENDFFQFLAYKTRNCKRKLIFLYFFLRKIYAKTGKKDAVSAYISKNFPYMKIL